MWLGMDLLMEAIKKAGYEKEVKLGMDVAASEFHVPESNSYNLDFKTDTINPDMIYSGSKMIEMYADLCKKYPVISIEDPFEQDDWKPCTELTKLVGDKVRVVGDDILVTNTTRIVDAGEQNACNALLMKVNQIGSITESIAAANMAMRKYVLVAGCTCACDSLYILVAAYCHWYSFVFAVIDTCVNVRYNWDVMTSHRSGETEDNYIADLAVGLRTAKIKAGAPCRSERTAKYNQLLRIEQELGRDAAYAGGPGVVV